MTLHLTSNLLYAVWLAVALIHDAGDLLTHRYVRGTRPHTMWSAVRGETRPVLIPLLVVASVLNVADDVAEGHSFTKSLLLTGAMLAIWMLHLVHCPPDDRWKNRRRRAGRAIRDALTPRQPATAEARR